MLVLEIFLRKNAKKFKNYMIFLIIFSFFSNFLNAKSLNGAEEAGRIEEEAHNGIPSAVNSYIQQHPAARMMRNGAPQSRKFCGIALGFVEAAGKSSRQLE